jgi:hypothetical protein
VHASMTSRRKSATQAASSSRLPQNTDFVRYVDAVADWVGRHRNGDLGPYWLTLATASMRIEQRRNQSQHSAGSSAGKASHPPQRRRTLSHLRSSIGGSSGDLKVSIPEICPRCRLSTRRWEFCGVDGSEHRPKRNSDAASIASALAGNAQTLSAATVIRDPAASESPAMAALTSTQLVDDSGVMASPSPATDVSVDHSEAAYATPSNVQLDCAP